MTDTQVLMIVVAVATLLTLAALAGIGILLKDIRDDAVDYYAWDVGESERYHAAQTSSDDWPKVDPPDGTFLGSTS